MNKKSLSLLLNPIFIISLIFGIQFFVWLFFMPSISNFVGVSNKFVSYDSILKYILFFALFVTGTLFGKIIVLSLSKTNVKAQTDDFNEINFYKSVAFIAFLLFLFGEVIYIRVIFYDPQIIISSLKNGFTVLGNYTHNNTLLGLSSLNNLFLIPTIIWSYFALSKNFSKRVSRKYKNLLFALGLIIVLHGLFLAGRMFIVYYFLILFGSFIIFSDSKIRRKILKYFVIIVIILIISIFVGEYLRSGILYSKVTGNSIFSSETFNYVSNRLLLAYLSSDLNNAMIILDSKPSMQLVSTAGSIATIVKIFGINFRSYASLPLWTSMYGTVNIFGLWWWDWGWLTIFISFFCGIWIGSIYELMIANSNNISIESMLFLITYPGFFSLSRINYFGLSIYILPLLYLIVVYILKNFRNISVLDQSLAHSKYFNSYFSRIK